MLPKPCTFYTFRKSASRSEQPKTVRKQGGLSKDLRIERLRWRDSVTPPTA